MCNGKCALWLNNHFNWFNDYMLTLIFCHWLQIDCGPMTEWPESWKRFHSPTTQCPLRFWVAHIKQQNKLFHFLFSENHLKARAFKKWNMSNEKQLHVEVTAIGCSWTTQTSSWDQYLSRHVQTCFSELAEVHLSFKDVIAISQW